MYQTKGPINLVKNIGGCSRLMKVERMKTEVPKLSPDEIKSLNKKPQKIKKNNKPTIPVSERNPKIKL